MRSSIAFLLLLSIPPACLGAGAGKNASTEVLLKSFQTLIASDAVKVKPEFVPLPPGAISPQGWLRDWSADAVNGITGHLDEAAPTFAEAWKGYGFEARGAKPDGTGWPLEQCAYWLDGAVRMAYFLNDAALIAKVAKRLDIVVDGVLNGGTSFIYWRPNSVLTDTFNNWAHSHIGRALVAYYQATGSKRVLEALVKVYRDYPIGELRNHFHDVTGAVNIDPMIETYVMSGDRKVLENVVAFSQRQAYRETSSEWLQEKIVPGHNVVFYENLRVPALLYPWTGDRDDLAATVKALEWHDARYMLPMGLSSGEEYHAGIGATRHTETCNIAASMWTYLWLLRITGDAGYSDRIERIFFNAAPAAVASDFKTMTYYQCANRYGAALPLEKPQYPGGEGGEFSNMGGSVLCCVGNLNRVLPNYIMHMWMATLDRGLAAVLYGPSRVNTIAGDNVPVEIDATTSYPFRESVTLTVKPGRSVTFPLYLRLPSWCRSPEVTVNGKRQPISGARKSFIKLERRWRATDRVTLRFPMSVQMVTGRETPYPRIDYFKGSRTIAKRTDINSPYATVSYGPLLFSLGIPDSGPNHEMPGARFNYALDVSQGQPRKDEVVIIRRPMPSRWRWTPDAPLQLVIRAKEFDWQPSDLQPLPQDPVSGGKPAKVTLVPYGCTKFRVTMFPVTAAAWESSNEHRAGFGITKPARGSK